jgi:hypothetical protein
MSNVCPSTVSLELPLIVDDDVVDRPLRVDGADIAAATDRDAVEGPGNRRKPDVALVNQFRRRIVCPVQNDLACSRHGHRTASGIVQQHAVGNGDGAVVRQSGVDQQGVNEGRRPIQSHILEGVAAAVAIETAAHLNPPAIAALMVPPSKKPSPA